MQEADAKIDQMNGIYGKKQEKYQKHRQSSLQLETGISGSIYRCPYMRDEKRTFIIDLKSVKVISHTDSTKT